MMLILQTILKFLSSLNLSLCIGAVNRSLHSGIFKNKGEKSYHSYLSDDNIYDNVFVQLALEEMLKVVSTRFLLVSFVSLKSGTCETRKNVFYFTSKAIFVLLIIRLFRY